MALLALMEKRK